MEPTRRFFIRTAAPAAMLFKLAGPKPELKGAGPNDQIALGFIGVGIRGSYLMDVFRKTPGVRAVMVADCYDGHLDWAKEATGGKIEVTKDYHDILARQDIDAVVIATPDHWHARMVLDSLAAGKHVYVEKPLTYTIEEGKQIIDAVKKSGKLLMVGSQNKTSTLTAKAREVVKSGILGKLNQCRLSDNRNSPEGAWVYPIPEDASPETIDWKRWLGPAPKIPFDAKRVFRWRCWWEYSGGVATDLWVHNFTTFHEVMDVKAPLSAVAQGGIYRFDDGRTCPDLLTGVYEYPNFLLEITANLGSSRRATGFLVCGSEASLSFGRNSVLVTFEPPPSPIAWYGLNGWTEAAKEKYLASIGYGGGKRPAAQRTKPPQEFPVERGLEHHEYFLKSLRENLPSMETAEEGHYAAGAAHLGNLAYRKKRRIRWNIETNKVSEG
ncbi:MAG TPA: Gfo/Idh/MocA family oxidoreductase [Bryobacteraceae bacterium]|nr:Gfo/Idh/MocA family oxidoreductase [Bryobacteraceae bacterium]HPU73524.1 Gfo/Idh/MocA family oxidoreductase [Bryobacteraceae bacterium]